MSKLRLIQVLLVILGLASCGYGMTMYDGFFMTLGFIWVGLAWLVKWVRFIWKD